MGKQNLGVLGNQDTGIQRDHLYIDAAVAKILEKDCQKQLEIIRTSLFSINLLLNKLVSQQYIKGSRINVYKGLARKTKTQAQAVDKLKVTLSEKYSEDLKNQPIRLLDDKIEELEKILRNATKE